MASVKNYFPGGNTSKGFVNYFDGIVAPWVENKRVYVLKGGPGVGKNTFMKAFGKKAEEKGYDIEYFHCASDSKSLDAVHIPKLGITMLDGTAPHVIDPVIPGAVDGIINLGVFLNEKGLETKRKEIEQLFQENKRRYQTAFSYLSAAGKLQDSSDYLYMQGFNYEELKADVQELFGSHTLKLGEYKGKIRKLFAEAITPQGIVNYIDELIDQKNIVIIRGPQLICSEYIRLAMEFASFMGYGCQAFYSALMPDEPIHLMIKELDLCITMSLEYGMKSEKIIDFGARIHPLWVSKYSSEFDINDSYTHRLREAAVSSLRAAKELHDDIEEIYKSYMNFDKVTKFTEKFIAEVL